MKRAFPRLLGMIVLAALLLNTMIILAQDEQGEPDRAAVVGSGIAAPFVQTALEAAGTAQAVEITVTGTSRGFDLFCAGEADVTLATRPIGVDEEVSCALRDVEFIELLMAFDAYALVAHRDAAFLQCLTMDTLNLLLAPSSQGTIMDWNQIDPELPSQPLRLALPDELSAVYALLDEQIEGDGLRRDFLRFEDENEILLTVLEDTSALGFVSYPVAARAAQDESLALLALDGGIAGCVSPSIETIEGRLYPGSRRLFAYINAANRDNANVQAIINALLDNDAAAQAQVSGALAPSPEIQERNRAIIENGQTGRQFTRDVIAFTIPQGLVGSITMAGSAAQTDYFAAVTSAFSVAQPGVQISRSMFGEADGFRRLCNGEIDLAVAVNPLNDEQADNCEANDVQISPLELGRQPVVLLANAQAGYTACLTLEQVVRAWDAASGDIVTWDQVDASFPSEPLILFAPAANDPLGDLLSVLAGGTGALRTDTEVNADVAFRAAAVANVPGALAYLSWPEYRRVLASDQTNVVATAIDAGQGCIAPSEATIADGSYALARPINLLINRTALARIEVQSLLWFMLSDENFTQIEEAGLVGLTFAELPDLRDSLQQLYAEVAAEVAAAAAAPQATEEPEIDEATFEATPAPDATAEAGN
ncbi:MAG: substrate-binding domain-containing protein [Aggregatilineales bacterium]